MLDEGQQRLLVVLPLEREFAFVGKLVAAQEDGQLKAVGVQVAEVVHTCRPTPQVRERSSEVRSVASIACLPFCSLLLLDLCRNLWLWPFLWC